MNREAEARHQLVSFIGVALMSWKCSIVTYFLFVLSPFEFWVLKRVFSENCTYKMSHLPLHSVSFHAAAVTSREFASKFLEQVLPQAVFSLRSSKSVVDGRVSQWDVGPTFLVPFITDSPKSHNVKEAFLTMFNMMNPQLNYSQVMR